MEALRDCGSIVAMLSQAGLDELILEQIWGNGLLPGATSDADIADPADPCIGTIPRTHSHFFTADGTFGSRDYAGQQVDDGRYVLAADDIVEINGARFRYSIDGDSLTLAPELPDISSCADMECRFPAAWMLMVALPGSSWTRSSES
jgi:hypothetical protein